MLSSFCRGFDRVVAFVAGLLVAALLVDVMLGIISRAFSDPFIWTDELARFLMIWLAVLGWILTSRKRVHVRIRYFQDKLPKTAWRTVEMAIQLALLVLGSLVGWLGFGLIDRNMDLDAMTLPISIAWMYVPLVPAGAVTALQALSELVEQCRRPSIVEERAAP